MRVERVELTVPSSSSSFPSLLPRRLPPLYHASLSLLCSPGDIQVLRQAFKYARTVSQTAPFSDYVLNELSPGDAVTTDDEWEAWIRKVVSTEYHPASSCSQMPESLGGVVVTSLRVYGVSNLRIVDASIIPISLSAHATGASLLLFLTVLRSHSD